MTSGSSRHRNKSWSQQSRITGAIFMPPAYPTRVLVGRHSHHRSQPLEQTRSIHVTNKMSSRTCSGTSTALTFLKSTQRCRETLEVLAATRLRRFSNRQSQSAKLALSRESPKDRGELSGPPPTSNPSQVSSLKDTQRGLFERHLWKDESDTLCRSRKNDRPKPIISFQAS